MNVRRRYLLALVGALALLAAGCGGHSDKKANEAYANSVCTAIGSWAKEIKSIATNTSGGISKASLDAKLAQFESATKNLVSQIKAIPPPNTSQGQAAKKQIDQMASQVETTTSAVKSTAEQIPANATAKQAVATLATLAPQLETLASSAKSTVKGVESAGGSLASAFESSRACKNLG
jgi:ABC-type glycerol-3-phosphate transport system substrate-binding protein